MKICIWTSKVFSLGGTRKMVTVLANELNKTHDVTIVTHESRKKENRKMYGLSEDVKVEFVVTAEFMQNIPFAQRKKNKSIISANNRKGVYNTDEATDVLLEATHPKIKRNWWIDFFGERDFDVIIATATFSLLLASIAPQLKAKTIGWQHSSYDGYFNAPDLLFWNSERMFSKHFDSLDAYVVLTKYDVKAFEDNLGLSVTAINNPCTVGNGKHSSLEKKNFLIAARLEEVKGVDQALDAFKLFAAHDEEWTLTIAGDGSLREEFIQYIWENDLQGRVRMVGMTDDMEKQYLESSIYLMTSRVEGWGLTVTESFAMGVPVIAYDIEPMDLMIDDGENGILVPAFDKTAFVKAMLKVSRDFDLRKRMSESAITKAEDFTVEKYVQKWENLFESIFADN